MQNTELRRRARPVLDALRTLALQGRTPVLGLHKKSCPYHSWDTVQEDPATAPGWTPFAPGDAIGGVEAHYCFRGGITAPAGSAGRHLVCLVSTGATDIWNNNNPQFLAYLNGALVVGITINWMFSQEYGLVNFIIRSLGGTALEWSLNPRLATFVIAFASVWASIGFNMILYIGGINSISNDLYEAATIDGASGVQAFFRITVPMLAPTTFMVVLLSTVNLLKEYALVQGITQGGPGLSTTFIIQYIFDKGFNQMQYGYASAISTVVMIIFALIAFAQFKVNNGGET